jgi:hypothetical protein
MNVICSVNGEQWDRRTPLYVCHHCGMPICAQHGLTIGADDAFDASDSPVSRAAMHCPACAEKHHRGVQWYHGWTDPKSVAPAVQQPNRASATAAHGQHARARG